MKKITEFVKNNASAIFVGWAIGFLIYTIQKTEPSSNDLQPYHFIIIVAVSIPLYVSLNTFLKKITGKLIMKRACRLIQIEENKLPSKSKISDEILRRIERKIEIEMKVFTTVMIIMNVSLVFYVTKQIVTLYLGGKQSEISLSIYERALSRRNKVA